MGEFEDVELFAVVGREGAPQDAFVEARCAEGQQVDYRVYEGRDHVPLVEPDSPAIPELVEWTQARLQGEPVEDTCG